MPITRIKNKEQAKQFLNGMKNIGKGISDYGKNVAGGAKIVSDSVRKATTKGIVNFIGDTKAGNILKKGLNKQGYNFSNGVNPNIQTTSKKNKMGEIINPTKSDIQKYNTKYQTVTLPSNIKYKK